jgi:UPF0716 family protein affecting phage T7 exclusion
MCLPAGLHGYLLAITLAWEQAFLIAAAVPLIKPGWITDLIGLALLAVVVAQMPRRGAQARVGSPAS